MPSCPLYKYISVYRFIVIAGLSTHYKVSWNGDDVSDFAIYCFRSVVPSIFVFSPNYDFCFNSGYYIFPLTRGALIEVLISHRGHIGAFGECIYVHRSIFCDPTRPDQLMMTSKVEFQNTVNNIFRVVKFILKKMQSLVNMTRTWNVHSEQHSDILNRICQHWYFVLLLFNNCSLDH